MKTYFAPQADLFELASADVLTTSQTFEAGDSTKLPTIGFGDFKF